MTNPTLPSCTKLKQNTYHILHLLGQGGFSAVYLARNLSTGTLCAIKENFDTSASAQSQFTREATILALLDHPVLPKVLDHFVEPSGKQYLVMEYIEGQDLDQLLSQGKPLPEPQVLGWMDQVLDAVAYLHARKPSPVIHRDIKPANIRLLPDGKRVKLVDFGIAKVGSKDTKTQSAARGVSDGYSPPEQYGIGTDTYSDVYALGATLYHLLTGKLSPVSTDIASRSASLQSPRQINSQISPRVEQVILTAMEIDSKLRFPDAGEMRKALLGQRPAYITVNCPHCGHEVRASARFCDQCGDPVLPVKPFWFKQASLQVRNVADLVRACDAHWQEALGYFRGGQIDAWLETLGAKGKKLATQARDLRAKHSDPSAALEAFLEAIAPTRPLPRLAVTPNTLDFGVLRLGDSKVLSLKVSNSGPGYLQGTVQSSSSWIQVHPDRFACLSGASQPVDVEVKTAGLTGTEVGVDHTETVTVRHSRGQQTVSVRVKVVDEPQAHLAPAKVDLGQVGWGTQSQGRVTITNRGGGTLRGRLISSVSWLLVDATAQNFALGRGQSQQLSFTMDATQFRRRGRHSGRLQVQTQKWGNPVCTVTVKVDVPYLLDPKQPSSAVSSVKELVAFCDSHWELSTHLLQAGRIEAFLRFIGKDGLADTAGRARRSPDASIGLESLLRAAGAEPPQQWRSNINDVLGQLGFGPLPKLFRKPALVSLFIENTSDRGYLHGYVRPLAPWLSVPQPRFGCLPGQIAQVRLHADHKARRGGLFSLNTELFEIAVE